MKRLLYYILAICICLGSYSNCVYAAGNSSIYTGDLYYYDNKEDDATKKKVGNWEYNVRTKTLSLVGSGTVHTTLPKKQKDILDAESIVVGEGIEEYIIWWDTDDDDYYTWKKVKSIVLPKSFSVEGAELIDAWKYPKLKTVNLSYMNSNIAFDDGVFFNKKKTRIISVLNTKKGELVIPDTVKKIEDLGAPNITSLTVPSSIRQVGTLSGSYKLKKITFLGKAPAMEDDQYNSPFEGLKMTVYYPLDKSWDKVISKYYIGDIVWIGNGNQGKKNNTITASGRYCTYSKKKQSFPLKAKAKGGAKLSYKSSMKSVKVDNNGVVTIAKGFQGFAQITITAAEAPDYNKAQKTITIGVGPKRPSIKSLKSSKGRISFKLSKEKCSFYEYCIAEDKYFQDIGYLGEGGALEISYNSAGYSTGKFKEKKLKKGKKYYIRVRTVNEKKTGYISYSPWVVKSIKVK